MSANAFPVSDTGKHVYSKILFLSSAYRTPSQALKSPHETVYD